MNVFYEFYKVAKRLRENDVPYALIGGVAMAFHTQPRFTKDIDLLVKQADFRDLDISLIEEGYTKSSPPWAFRDTALTLHRYLKVEDDDELMIDVLVAGTKEHELMIDCADIAESDSLGVVRVVRRQDLIELKLARNSKLDQADIEQLENEQA